MIDRAIKKNKISNKKIGFIKHVIVSYLDSFLSLEVDTIVVSLTL